MAAACNKAREAMTRYSYSEVLGFLEEFPEAVRSDEARALFSRAADSLEEYLALQEQIERALKRKNAETLLPLVTRFLVLKPDNLKMERLAEHLEHNSPARAIATYRGTGNYWDVAGRLVEPRQLVGGIALILLIFAGVTVAIHSYLAGSRGELPFTGPGPTGTDESPDDPASADAGTEIVSIPSTTVPPVMTDFPEAHPIAETKPGIDMPTTLPPDLGEQKNRPTLPGSQTDFEGTPGFRPLYRDLSEWASPDGFGRRWFVLGQVLTGTNPYGDESNPHSWIYTLDDYSDFRLRFETRMLNGADSGFALRTHAGVNDRFEIQLLTDVASAVPTGTILGRRLDAARPNTAPRKAAVLRPAGQWNLVEVEFRGTRLKVTFNETLIQDVKMEELPGASKGGKKFSPSGSIALQCRFGTVQFRRMEIQELPAADGE